MVHIHNDIGARMDVLQAEAIRLCDEIGKICTSPNADGAIREVRSMLTPQIPQLQSDASLVFGLLPDLWFTKRQVPTFDIQLVDGRGNRIHFHGSLRLTLHLEGSDQRNLDHIIASSAQTTFTFTEGRVVVSGLRFSAVSSKNGGSFRLKAVVSPPNGYPLNIPPVLSHDIRVISERLFSETKASSISALAPSDKIIHIMGLGKKYSKRLNKLGYETVKDLANLELDQIPDFTAALKQGRGTITPERLQEIVVQCREVVRKHGGTIPPPYTPSSTPSLSSSISTASLANQDTAPLARFEEPAPIPLDTPDYPIALESPQMFSYPQQPLPDSVPQSPFTAYDEAMVCPLSLPMESVFLPEGFPAPLPPAKRRRIAYSTAPLAPLPVAQPSAAQLGEADSFLNQDFF